MKMLLPQVDYYEIRDISEPKGTKKAFAVVAEYDNEREARENRSRLKIRGCEVYADVGERIWRVICDKTKMTSDAENADCQVLQEKENQAKSLRGGQ